MHSNYNYLAQNALEINLIWKNPVQTRKSTYTLWERTSFAFHNKQQQQQNFISTLYYVKYIKKKFQELEIGEHTLLRK